MSRDAMCPICQVNMMHACGHPTLPRLATALLSDGANMQYQADDSCQRASHGDVQTVTSAPKVSARQGKDDEVAAERASISACHDSIDGGELQRSASRRSTQPAKTPYFLQMAYPQNVDLAMPCAYCYLAM